MHGLELEGKKPKKWTGNIIDGKLRVRVCFLDRPLDSNKAIA